MSADVVVDLWRVDLDGRSRPLVGLIATLSADERDRMGRLRTGELRRRFALGRAALRDVLAGACGLEPTDIAFAASPCAMCGGPHGKPVLTGARGLHFSFSRSEGLALIAVAGSEVGVDVECRRRAIHADAIAEDVLDAGELVAVRSIPDDRRCVAILDRWTQIEALAKHSGTGIGAGLETLTGRPADVTIVDLAEGLPSASGTLAVRAADPHVRWRAW